MPIARRMTISERLEAGTVRQADGCRVWQRSTTTNGYGQIRIDGRLVKVHRVVYEMQVGPIPPGMQIDHLCRVRACCEPTHMEVVTNRENVLRGIGPTARNAAKTHCLRGHPFSGNNLRIASSGRKCRTCERLRLTAAWRHRYMEKSDS